MAENRALMKFAAKVVGFRAPGNWDRPLGYDGTAQYVAVYWDRNTNSVFITDGISGSSGGAWWLYSRLIDLEARQEIHAALMACGANPQKALGDSENEASYALILDRHDHCLWIGSISEASRFLTNQH